MRNSLLAGLALAAASLGLGCGSPEEPRQLHGATLSWWANEDMADSARELDLLADAGGDVVRFDIGWSTLEQAGKGRQLDESRYYVERIDRFLELAEERDVEVVGILTTAPCWASSAPEALKQGCGPAWLEEGSDVPHYAPADPEDFADIAAWVAERWGGKGDRPGLRALELWNEPNFEQFLKTPGSPRPERKRRSRAARAYAGMLKAAYPKVKEAAPGLTVLGGALGNSDGEFLTEMYRRGAAGSYDAISHHPYNEGRDPADPGPNRVFSFTRGTQWLREIMVARGEAQKELWITEMGYGSCGTDRDPETDPSPLCVTEEDHARYTEAAHRIARGWPFVRAMITYNMRDTAADAGGSFGLVREDFSAKPALDAFERGAAGR